MTTRIFSYLAFPLSTVLAVVQFVIVFLPVYPLLDLALYFSIGFFVKRGASTIGWRVLVAIASLPVMLSLWFVYLVRDDLTRGVGVYHVIAVAVIPLALWLGWLAGGSSGAQAADR